VCIQAIRSLENIGGAGAIDALMRAMRNENATKEVLEHAAMALNGMDGRRVASDSGILGRPRRGDFRAFSAHGLFPLKNAIENCLCNW
jgi:hypothetical protein